MSREAWALVAAPRQVAATVRTARTVADRVTVLAVGPREVADAASAAGPDRVLWAETADGRPAEALTVPVADAVAAAAPDLLLAAGDPAARALLGAAAARRGAALVSGMLALRADGDALSIDRTALDGEVVATVTVAGPVAVLVDGDDEPADAATPAPVEPLTGQVAPADLVLTATRAAEGGSGLYDAARVVSIGRGVKAKDDLALVEQLTAALDAELACSMPVADDLGWVPKDRYVGRSGQKIAPRLYLALGIAGMPQHMEGIRDAKVVAAVNTDPDAPVFRAADYGIVGDLYEVVPALVAALGS